MKGHIRARGKGTWALIVDLGRDAAGKRKQKWHSFTGTKRDAQKKLAGIIAGMDDGTYVEPAKLSVGSYLKSWLEQLDVQGLAPRTIIDHKLVCERHLIPALGHIPLQKLSAMHIDGYYRSALAGGRLKGEGAL